MILEAIFGFLTLALIFLRGEEREREKEKEVVNDEKGGREEERYLKRDVNLSHSFPCISHPEKKEE